MNFLNKMERKFGRFAIHNLTKYIIGCYIIGYILLYLQPLTGVNLMGFLYLSPYHILHFQIWRLVSWILIPPSSSNILFVVIMLLFLLFFRQFSGEDLGSFSLQCVYTQRNAVYSDRSFYPLSYPGTCQYSVCPGIFHILYQSVYFSGFCSQLSGYAGAVYDDHTY